MATYSMSMSFDGEYHQVYLNDSEHYLITSVSLSASDTEAYTATWPELAALVAEIEAGRPGPQLRVADYCARTTVNLGYVGDNNRELVVNLQRLLTTIGFVARIRGYFQPHCQDAESCTVVLLDRTDAVASASALCHLAGVQYPVFSLLPVPREVAQIENNTALCLVPENLELLRLLDGTKATTSVYFSLADLLHELMQYVHDELRGGGGADLAICGRRKT